MIDDVLSSAVVRYVGVDMDAAVPGRHPDRIADGAIRARVVAIVAEADAAEPGVGDLFAWAESVRNAIALNHPELSPDALVALRALISYEWR